MTIVESLPTYGIHFYEVKDKANVAWWLGLSHKGVSAYDYADKTRPKKVSDLTKFYVLFVYHVPDETEICCCFSRVIFRACEAAS